MANEDRSNWVDTSAAGGGSGSGTAAAALSDGGPRVSVTSVSLLRQAREGDQNAWRRLVRLYAPLVQYWCRNRGVRGADVEDVVQEVFQGAAQRLEHFRRTRADDSFRGWLHGITRHKVLEFHRRRGAQPQAEGGSEMNRRLAELSDDPGALDQDQPADRDDPRLLHELFRTVVEMVRGEFEQRTWTAFWRTVIDGQSAVSVAEELGIAPASVRMAKCRILRRVREQLGDWVD